MGVGGVVLDRRLNQDAEEEDRLVSSHCAKAQGALLACRASLDPRTVLILGKAERPVAQGPGHAQPGQGETHWLLVTSGNRRASACSSLPQHWVSLQRMRLFLETLWGLNESPGWGGEE